MHKPVPLAQPVQPHARPRREVVPPDLVVADREAHKGQLVHEPADVLELELLAGEVDVAAAVRPRLGLVLALALVAAVLNVAAAQAVEGVDVELDLDVGLEALGVGVAGGQGDALGGEEGEGEVEGLGGDLGCRRVGLEGRSVAFDTVVSIPS